MTRIVLFVGLCFAIAFTDGVVAPENDARILYEGSQLLRVVAPTKKLKDEILKLEDSGDLNLWSELARNNSNVDVLVNPATESKVKEYFKSHNLEYEVLIENLQAAIDAENPKLSDEEIEELVGRKASVATNYYWLWIGGKWAPYHNAYRQSQSRYKVPRVPTTTAASYHKGHRMTWQQYHRLSDIHGYLDYLGQTFPDLCSVQSIGNSIEGRPLKLITISSGKPNAPAIWIDGGVHAREWISPSSVTYLINELVENRDAHGPHIQGIDFFIIPVSNPDGYEHSHTKNRLWRKNRGNAEAGACGGIDLNRNFGYKWGGPGSSKQPCKETYAGSGQFSEPETQGISRFVLANSQKIKASISFHSYGQYILYPWGYDRVVPPDYRDLHRVGKAMGQAISGVSGKQYTVGSAASTLYPASGGSDDWAKGVAKIKYTYTIELRDTGRHGFILPASEIMPTANEALAAVKALAEEVVTLTA